MRRSLILMLLALLWGRAPLYAWGSKGHDIVAYIAECHLTPRAARAVDSVLEGHSLVYYANWLDNASHGPEYAHTKTWHYKNIDADETLETMPQEPKGDILTALDSLVGQLKSGKLTHAEENICLRMVIHLVGDLHCPMHTGHLSDLGGNRVKVQFFSEQSNLHTVWDSSLIEAAHRWSYTEWQREIDRLSRKEAKAVAEGSPESWFLESHAICRTLYEECPAGSRLSYDEVAHYTPTIEQQLLRGGLRLARLLNEIYR